MTLEDALRACVKDICNAIVDGSLDPGPSTQETLWERASDGHFRARNYTCPLLILAGLESRPSFKACADKAESDPIIGPQIDELVGTRDGQQRVSIDQVVKFLVRRMWTEDERFEYGDEQFSKVKEEEEDVLNHENVRQILSELFNKVSSAEFHTILEEVLSVLENDGNEEFEADLGRFVVSIVKKRLS